AVLRRPHDDRSRRRAGARTRACSSRAEVQERDVTVPTAHRWAIPSLIALVIVLTLLSIAVGRVTLSWDLWSTQDAVSRAILIELRLPRAILGLLVGAALGMAGAAMQGYLRNALAEPGTLSVSAMAALGAVL